MSVQVLRPGQRILTIPGHGLTVTSGRATLTAGGDWWLSGGVAAANAVAVYKAIGAASLAASYDNIAAPGNGLADGTYDAAPGGAPTLDASGWVFDGTQYLDTGYAPSHPASMIVRFSDLSGSGGPVLLGSSTSTQWQWFALASYYGSTQRFGAYYTIFTTAALKVLSGVYAITADATYLNGTYDKAVGGTTLGTQRTIYIGTVNETQTGAMRRMIGKIQAVAIYNTTLTAAQIGLISAAMAAL